MGHRRLDCACRHSLEHWSVCKLYDPGNSLRRHCDSDSLLSHHSALAAFLFCGKSVLAVPVCFWYSPEASTLYGGSAVLASRGWSQGSVKSPSTCYRGSIIMCTVPFYHFVSEPKIWVAC